MPTVRFLERTGKDGVLHLNIPLGEPEVEYEAIVVLQSRSASCADASNGWPADYFARTFGSIADETFARQPQGELGRPVDLE